MANRFLDKINFYQLFSGLFIAQLINLIGFFILPRLYKPEDFAVFGVFTSIVFIIIEIVNLKLDIALQVTYHKSEQQELFLVACLVGIILSAFVLVPFIFFYPIEICIGLFITFLLYAINQPILAFLNILNQSKKIGISRIITASSTIFFSIFLIKYLHMKSGLIYGFVIGQCCAFIYNLLVIRNDVTFIIDYNRIYKNVQSYWQFPIFGVSSSVVNSVSRNAIIPMIDYFFGTVFCGFYTMSVRLLLAPANLYQTAMTQSFLQNAKNLSNDDLKKTTINTFIFGATLGIFPALLILFFGENIFHALFGNEWKTAGKLSQYLILWFFASTIVSPISMIFDIKKMLKKELYFNLFFLIIRMSVIIFGYYYLDFWYTMLFLSICGVLLNLLLYFYILKLLDIES